MTTSASRTKPSRLGRGLSSLMGQVGQPVQVMTPPAIAAAAFERVEAPPSAAGHRVDIAPSADQPAASPHDGLVHLSLAAITPNPFQPRQHFDKDALERLAQSIRAQGMMQPVIVRTRPRPRDQMSGSQLSGGNGQDGVLTYELVAGERRWRAAQLAGLSHVPALIRALDDRHLAQFALVENLQREDLNAIERAHAFQQLAQRFNLTHDQIAREVGVDRATISNSLRLLSLHEDIQELVRQNVLSAGQARALAGLVDVNQQLLLAHKAVRQDWSVRQVEAAVRQLADQAAADAAPSPPTKARAAHFADMETQIGQQLATKVHIRPGRRKGSGTLSIDFYSLDQFDALMARLGVTMQ